MVRQQCIAVASCLLICLFSTTSASAASTRTLVDQLGRTVTLPQKVERIIPLGGAARFVVYLQAFDLVVGVEAMEARQPPSAGRPYNIAIRKLAEKLPVVGEGRQKPVNPEAIIALRPDLLITAEADRVQADHLARLTGVPVLALDYGGWGVLQPDKSKQALKLLGTALNRTKRAQQLIDFFSLQEQQLKARIKQPSRKQVYIGAVSQRGNHGITSTDADYFPLLAAQGVNLARQPGRQGHLYIDKEQLLSWNPSIILLDAAGVRLVQEDYNRNSGFYKQLAAVQNNQVFVTLPYNNYHTNLELALANSWYVAKLLHPASFRDSDPASKTDELCKAFVGITCYEQLRKEFGGFGPAYLAPQTGHVN